MKKTKSGKSQVKKPMGGKKAPMGGRKGDPKGRYSGGKSTVKVPC